MRAIFHRFQSPTKELDTRNNTFWSIFLEIISKCTAFHNLICAIYSGRGFCVTYPVYLECCFSISFNWKWFQAFSMRSEGKWPEDYHFISLIRRKLDGMYMYALRVRVSNNGTETQRRSNYECTFDFDNTATRRHNFAENTLPTQLMFGFGLNRGMFNIYTRFTTRQTFWWINFLIMKRKHSSWSRWFFESFIEFSRLLPALSVFIWTGSTQFHSVMWLLLCFFVYRVTLGTSGEGKTNHTIVAIFMPLDSFLKSIFLMCTIADWPSKDYANPVHWPISSNLIDFL